MIIEFLWFVSSGLQKLKCNIDRYLHSKNTNDSALVTKKGIFKGKDEKRGKIHTATPQIFPSVPLLGLFFLHTFCKMPKSSISAGPITLQLFFFFNFRNPFSSLLQTKITLAPRFPPVGLCLSHASSHGIYFIRCLINLLFPFCFLRKHHISICVQLFQLLLQGINTQSFNPKSSLGSF